MAKKPPAQLVSYIAPAAPATRRPATGDEPFLRPEIGFTPRWYRESLGIDFTERWHTEPSYRCDTIRSMAKELRTRFGTRPIGWVRDPLEPSDLLTGTFGACAIAAIYGVPIRYAVDQWPNCAHAYLSAGQIDRLAPPDLDTNPFFCSLRDQLEWIVGETGRIEGYVNWQGVLNNAFRLRGEELFVDMVLEPARAGHLFECITTTMVDAARRVYEYQRQTGFDVRHFTVSNCLVNMVSPKEYRDLLMPFDHRIAEAFELIGVHNCAWNADAYIDDYATLPSVGYIDMGLESDLVRARTLFPDTRRALMYTPMDVANKKLDQIRKDLERIAREYGPCDIVFADIEAGTPDERVSEIVDLCDQLSEMASRDDAASISFT